MSAFYKVLGKLHDEAEVVWPEQPQPPESSLHPSLESQSAEKEEVTDHASLGRATYHPTNNEPEENAGSSVEASSTLTGERQEASSGTNVTPLLSNAKSQDKVTGIGSLNIRLMDQYPSYGISDKGELTVMGDTLADINPNVSDAGTELQRGSFLEESDFSLVTKETTPQYERVRRSTPTVIRTRSDINVGVFVQDSNTNGKIPPEQTVAENTETSTDSLLQPCSSPTIEPSQFAIISNQNVSVLPRGLILPPGGVDLQAPQIPEEVPLSSGLVPQQTQHTQVRAPAQNFQQGTVSQTPSINLDLTTRVKAGNRFPHTPQTAASSRPMRLSQLSDHSQNPAVSAPVQFPQTIQCTASYNQDWGSSEKPMSVQNVPNLQVATSKLQPNFLSNTTGQQNITPTSLLDAQLPFQFGDTNVKSRNRQNTSPPEIPLGVTLDHNQVLENDRLIRHDRNMIGKRHVSSPDNSLVTPAKRIRLDSKETQKTGLQAPQDVNTRFTDIQMSSVPTQRLLKGHSAASPGLTTAGSVAMQNCQAQAAISPVMIPNTAPSIQNAGPMHPPNQMNTNVRSEDVDLPKRYHCKACLAVFSFKENCDRHYKVVHLKRQVFQCPHCASSYLQPKTMRGHIDKKHCVRTNEVSILPCYWCPATYSTHQEWEFHAAQVHPEQRCKFRGMPP